MKKQNKFNNALITVVFAVLLFGLAFNAEDSNKISGAMVRVSGAYVATISPDNAQGLTWNRETIDITRDGTIKSYSAVVAHDANGNNYFYFEKPVDAYHLSHWPTGYQDESRPGITDQSAYAGVQPDTQQVYRLSDVQQGTLLEPVDIACSPWCADTNFVAGTNDYSTGFLGLDSTTIAVAPTEQPYTFAANSDDEDDLDIDVSSIDISTNIIPPLEEERPPAEPVVAEPVVAEPVVAEPVVAEPVVAEPVVAEPVVAEPVVEPVMTDTSLDTAKIEEDFFKELDIYIETLPSDSVPAPVEVQLTNYVGDGVSSYVYNPDIGDGVVEKRDADGTVLATYKWEDSQNGWTYLGQPMGSTFNNAANTAQSESTPQGTSDIASITSYPLSTITSGDTCTT